MSKDVWTKLVYGIPWGQKPLINDSWSTMVKLYPECEDGTCPVPVALERGGGYDEEFFVLALRRPQFKASWEGAGRVDVQAMRLTEESEGPLSTFQDFYRRLKEPWTKAVEESLGWYLVVCYF